MQTVPSKKIYDAVIVGAGIGGVITLKYAKAAGLKVIALEKKSDLGGLWRDLPDWQDIQSTKEDWGLNGLCPPTEYRSDIQENIRRLAKKYSLENDIRYDCPVEKLEHQDSVWKISTPRERFLAKYVLLATGAHNVPCIPDFERVESKVQEYHSYHFKDPRSLNNESVTIVGGGASAFDLLDLALTNGAKEVHWVYRNLKWFVPTSGKKHFKTNLRFLAKHQMLGATTEQLNRRMNQMLRAKYDFFNIADIMPDDPFDFNRQQIIPGRPEMIKKFKNIIRHKGEIQKIDGNTVVTTADRFQTDMILYGTGYQLDLSYLGLEKLNNIKNIHELRERCGTLFLSLDYPNLFFCGLTLLDTNSTAPWFYSVIAKSIISHVAGKSQFPKTPVVNNVNHWNIMKLLAKHDRFNYPPWWKIKFILKAIYYDHFREKIVHYD